MFVPRLNERESALSGDSSFRFFISDFLSSLIFPSSSTLYFLVDNCFISVLSSASQSFSIKSNLRTFPHNKPVLLLYLIGSSLRVPPCPPKVCSITLYFKSEWSLSSSSTTPAPTPPPSTLILTTNFGYCALSCLTIAFVLPVNSTVVFL